MIESIPVDRAKQRATIAYDVLPNLRVGLEANPKDDDYGPLVNWRVFDETDKLPAIVLGTSTDRIGTPSGRAVYATASKDLEAWTTLPIAPYVGVNYSGFDHSFDLIGGLNIRYPKSFSSTHFYDGDNVHHLLAHQFENGITLGILRADQANDAFWGLTFGTSF
ncbi:MAG: hypothetical protein ACI8TQ_002718 [Planctomycetota bacterium]